MSPLELEYIYPYINILYHMYSWMIVLYWLPKKISRDKRSRQIWFWKIRGWWIFKGHVETVSSCTKSTWQGRVGQSKAVYHTKADLSFYDNLAYNIFVTDLLSRGTTNSHPFQKCSSYTNFTYDYKTYDFAQYVILMFYDRMWYWCSTIECITCFVILVSHDS